MGRRHRKIKKEELFVTFSIVEEFCGAFCVFWKHGFEAPISNRGAISDSSVGSDPDFFSGRGDFAKDFFVFPPSVGWPIGDVVAEPIVEAAISGTSFDGSFEIDLRLFLCKSTPPPFFSAS